VNSATEVNQLRDNMLPTKIRKFVENPPFEQMESRLIMAAVHRVWSHRSSTSVAYLFNSLTTATWRILIIYENGGNDEQSTCATDALSVNLVMARIARAVDCPTLVFFQGENGPRCCDGLSRCWDGPGC
jgi:hypothetical protein